METFSHFQSELIYLVKRSPGMVYAFAIATFTLQLVVKKKISVL